MLPTSNPTPKRRRRLALRLGLGVLGLLLFLLAGLPFWLSTGSGRTFLLSRANEALAPGGLKFASFNPSWFGPVQMTEFTLIDPQGDRVLQAGRAVWDRTLLQLLFDRPHFGTLDLIDAELDVERLPDGTIDLHETLRPVLKPNPDFSLTVKLRQAKFRVRSEGLVEPLVADSADISLVVPTFPDALSWHLDLKGPTAQVAPARLEIEGSLDRWRARPGEPANLDLVVHSRRWPLAIGTQDLVAQTILDGSTKAARTSGLWSLQGETTLFALAASGPLLRGDHPKLERVETAWDLDQNRSGWFAHKLSVRSSVGHLEADGDLGPAISRNTRLDGLLDLPSLALLLPNTLRLRPGLVVEKGSVKVSIHPDTDTRNQWNAAAKVSELLARIDNRPLQLKAPADLIAQISLGEAGSARIEKLAVKSPYLQGEASGDFDRGIKAHCEFDLSEIKRELGDWLQLDKLELAGTGQIRGIYTRNGDQYLADFDTTLNPLDIQGFRTPSVKFKSTVEGPAAAEGLPALWETIRISGDSQDKGDFNLVATKKGTVVDIQGGSHLAISIDRQPLEVATRLAGSWQNGKVAIRSIEADLNRQGRILANVKAQGLIDAGAGEVTLMPVTSANGGSLLLEGEGIHMTLPVGGRAWSVDGSLSGDVAIVDRLISEWQNRPESGQSGRWTAKVAGNARRFGGKLEWLKTEKPEATIAWQLDQEEEESQHINVSEFVLSSRLGSITASGQVDRDRYIDLKGSIAPDWKAINASLPATAGPDAGLEGKPRPFRLSGSLNGSSLAGVAKQLDGEVGVDLTQAKLYGLTLGPMPLGLRARGGRVELIPIDTSVNEGKLRLEAELEFDTKGRALARIRPDSYVRDAKINDDVSHTFLAFVAPILSDATRVKGSVDIGVRDGLFPLVAHPENTTTFEGSVVFRDVSFGPGPLADDLLVLVSPDRVPNVKLDQPVFLSIADGKVHQKGLSIPISNLSRIEIEGWVGFDRTIALTASLPVTSALLGNQAILADIAAGTTVKVPLRGNLNKPQIDREVLAQHMKELGGTLLRRGAMRGAAELFLRTRKPADPPKSKR